MEPYTTDRLATVGQGYTTARQIAEELQRCELFEEIAEAGALDVDSDDAATLRFRLDGGSHEFIVTVTRVLKDHGE